jgi:thymidylate synthase
MITSILCCDANGGISKDGKIPWNSRLDRLFFRDFVENQKNTIGIFGRKTYEIMLKYHPKYFEHNFAWVISNNRIDSVKTFDNLDIKFAKEIHYIIFGGKTLYDKFLPISDIIYLTIIKNDYQCDNKITFPILEYKNRYTFQEDGHEIEFYSYYQHENEEERKFQNTLYEIIKAPSHSCRGENTTYSSFSKYLHFNLSKFPLLTTKKVFFKAIFEELMLFIRGQTDSSILREKGVKIWDSHTSKSFIEKSNLNLNEGDMGPIYGFQLTHYGEEYKTCKDSYYGYNQISYCLNLLLNDPYSRRILMTTFNPVDAHKSVLFPCHGISINFTCDRVNEMRETNDVNEMNEANEMRGTYKLNIHQTQRSGDMFLGIPFNIASYALLNYMFCHILNEKSYKMNLGRKYIPGELSMLIVDAHVYKEHYDQCFLQILRENNTFPTLEIMKFHKNIEDFQYEDFKIVDYYPKNKLIAEIVQ